MKVKLVAFFMLMIPVLSYAQKYNITEAAQPEGKTIVFRFVADNDTFFVPYQGNGDKLNELVATIDHYKSAITNGQATINVAGYCSSYVASKENLHSASIRANRIKSELIVRNSIKEANFLTTVHASSFEGRKSVVVVTLRVPQISKPVVEVKPAVKEEPKKEVVAQAKPEPVVEQPMPEQQPVIEPKEEPASIVAKTIQADDYQFALRTNLLYDAMLAPNIGIEWHVNNDWSVKVDAGGGKWGSATGNIHKMWHVNPEVRYYMGNTRRFYVGIAGNYSKYNIYKGMFGNLISKDTGYQGSMWNAGATVGYQLPLCKALSLDFNLGLGYNSFEYDSFNLINGVRVYKDRNQTKSRFGLTQAGVSLVWKMVE
ncbi:MAG: DUF3575 domain-containing protein [Tannerellaceae bacterium]|jgi:hypothetical protein|nr:DUF3575 domain-containing protein [Tannerellaceae bacterium]